MAVTYSKGVDVAPNRRKLMEFEYLTVEQVAKQMGVSEKTVRNYINRGDLQAYKLGTAWKITEEALKSFIESKSNIKKDGN